MRWRIPIVISLALFVVVSCDQKPVEPLTDQVAESPVFNFSNGPDAPGSSVVFRWEEDSRWYFIVTDWKKGLMAHVSNDPEGKCTSTPESGTPFDIQVAGFNAVLDGSDWYAYVYDPTGFSGDFCAFFEANDPFASGMIDFHTHLGQADDYKAGGWVDFIDGSGMAHLGMHLGVQYDPHPPYDFIGFRVQNVRLSQPRG